MLRASASRSLLEAVIKTIRKRSNQRRAAITPLTDSGDTPVEGTLLAVGRIQSSSAGRMPLAAPSLSIFRALDIALRCYG